VNVAVAAGKGASVGGDVGVGVAPGLKLHAIASSTSVSSKKKRFIMKSTPFDLDPQSLRKAIIPQIADFANCRLHGIVNEPIIAACG
jgi:hypothetical protein